MAAGCSAHGNLGIAHKDFEMPEGSSKVLGVDGRIILNWIVKKTECEGVEWIHLTQDKKKRTCVTSAMKLMYP
jgi:hypothetical protein